MPALDAFLTGLGPLPVGGLVILIACLLFTIYLLVDYAIACGRSRLVQGHDPLPVLVIVRIAIPDQLRAALETEAGQ